MTLQAKALNRPLFAIFAVCSLIAVFYFPYFVPQAPSTSDSWVFGYNNRAGILLLLAFVATGVYWTRGVGLNILAPAPAKPLSNKLLYAAIAATCCCFAIMYVLAGGLGGFEEATYQIDRVWLLEQGKQPYVDFEYAYGAGLLYGPMILQRIFRVDVAQGYYIFLLITLLAGTFIAFRLISTCNYPSNLKKSIFLLFFIPGLPSIISMGTNYTGLRFATPLYFVSLYHGMLIENGKRLFVRSSLAAVFFTAVLILISPEMSLAFGFACPILYVLCAPPASNRTLLPSTGILLLLLGSVFWVAWRLQAFDTLASAADNANSFPIAICPHILFYIMSLFVCCRYLFVRFLNDEFSDRMIGFVLVAIPMAAGALGRCDPGHVGAYGFGLILPSMLLFSNSPVWFRRYRNAYLAFLVIIPFLSGLVVSQPNLFRVLHIWKPSGFANVPAAAISVDELFPSWKGEFLAPFGFRPNGYGTTLSARIEYGRYEGTLNNNTAASIQETISEIEVHPEKAMLLPRGFDAFCSIDPNFERLDMSLLFAFPYFGRAVHTVSVRQPLCNFIVENYQVAQPPTAQTFYWGLWVRKPQARSEDITEN